MFVGFCQEFLFRILILSWWLIWLLCFTIMCWLSWAGALCGPGFLCSFILRITSGPIVTICGGLKCFKPLEVYVSGSSKAAVLVLLLFCGFYYGAFHVESYLALCSHIFQSCMVLWSPQAGQRKLVCILLVHVYVHFARDDFCSFSFLLAAGLAVACDCGTPWNYYNYFFFIYLFQRLCTSGKQINKCQALTSKVSFQGN